MVFSYFPGCTLKSKAKDLDLYALNVAKALDLEVKEINEWVCCGGVYNTDPMEVGTKLSSIRALDYAKHEDGLLLTLCSGCHNVLKRVNDQVKNNSYVHDHANNYLKLDETYNGETKVVHYVEMLRDYAGYDKIKAKTVNPINKKVGAYYGCLLLRPSNVMAFDNPENPTIMENLLSAIGATPVKFAFRNECCGGYNEVKKPELVKQKVEKIFKNAKDGGVEMLVTACPLCFYNLNKYNDTDIEVKYISEVLATALGVEK